MKRKVLLIVGPTGIGKTGASLKLAETVVSEIVSADSRQLYKHMNIGTAKPTSRELAAVPHHFIDIKRPDEYYSAGQFGEEARACIAGVFDRRKQPLVVGGSGLYVKALVDGFFGPKIADAATKTRLKQDVQEMGLGRLYERLKQVDPETAARLHPTDSQRILRALEVHELTGQRFSEFQAMESRPAGFEPVFVGLTMDRGALYERIERRVDEMLSEGLVAEVESLHLMGFGPDLNAMQTVGYREAFAHLNGELSLSEMAALIKQKTRNYAKRQFTWFRKDKRITWMQVGSELPTRIENLLN